MDDNNKGGAHALRIDFRSTKADGSLLNTNVHALMSLALEGPNAGRDLRAHMDANAVNKGGVEASHVWEAAGIVYSDGKVQRGEEDE